MQVHLSKKGYIETEILLFLNLGKLTGEKCRDVNSCVLNRVTMLGSY